MDILIIYSLIDKIFRVGMANQAYGVKGPDKNLTHIFYKYVTQYEQQVGHETQCKAFKSFLMYW